MAEYSPTMRTATFLRHPGRLRGSKEGLVSKPEKRKEKKRKEVDILEKRQKVQLGGCSRTLGISTRRWNENNTLMRI
jgi:hypothetical protein